MARTKAIDIKWLFIFLAPLFLTTVAASDQPQKMDIRRSIIQGSWYPGNPASLKRVVNKYLSDAKNPEVPGRIRALIVPHAAYRYSGPVAGHAYKLLRGEKVDRVVMIGPSHRFGFEGVSVSCHDAYETPLGLVPLDRGISRDLIESNNFIRFIRKAHEREHSLEIQLPFLQCALDDFSIVPVLMGRQDIATCEALAESLANVLKDRPGTLIVASTDLSHYHSDKVARRLDKKFADYVGSYDPKGLAGALSAGQCEACGGGPTIAAMLASKMMGAERCVILRYATSGDVTGDREKVVGYLAAAITSGE
jgi:AmmeMemoRadiSam system protein B